MHTYVCMFCSKQTDYNARAALAVRGRKTGAETEAEEECIEQIAAWENSRHVFHELSRIPTDWLAKP